MKTSPDRGTILKKSWRIPYEFGEVLKGKSPFVQKLPKKVLGGKSAVTHIAMVPNSLQSTQRQTLRRIRMQGNYNPCILGHADGRTGRDE